MAVPKNHRNKNALVARGKYDVKKADFKVKFEAAKMVNDHKFAVMRMRCQELPHLYL